MLGRYVVCIRQAALHGRIVSAAGGNDNTGVGGEMGNQKMEQEGVADMANGKGRFDALGGQDHLIWEL